jgi:polyhydroxybutyrate depolymerase
MTRWMAGLVLMAWAALVAQGAGGQLVEQRWTVDGVVRQALVSVPAAAAVSNTPVLFVFHGHGGNRRSMALMSGYHLLWPEAIVVYMQGVLTPGKLTDPEGKKTGWQDTPGTYGDRDLRFFDQVLASLKSDYKVDGKRVFATGYSHGGYFTYLLWAQRADQLAAVAPCAATAMVSGPLLKPMPALHVAGTHDTLVKWEWQRLTMERVRKLNGCAEQGEPWASTGTLTGVLYPSTNGTPFVALTHPGSHAPAPGMAPLVIRFFKEH